MAKNEAIYIPKGFVAGGVCAGIKASEKPDLGMILCEKATIAAATLTTNQFQAAPIQVTSKRLASRRRHIRGVIVNSGNANAMTGAQGIKDAYAMIQAAEKGTECPAGSFLVASTGIIGKAMPMDRVEAGVQKLVKALSADGWENFASAIMTTDLRRKISSRRIELPAGETASILGIAKGSGMIQPNMATMLAFIVTDFPLLHGPTKQKLLAAVDQSFNCLTVDGQTSTNDMALLMCSNPIRQKQGFSNGITELFLGALTEVCQDLAKEIALDGEGATKLVTIRVEGTNRAEQSRQLALEVANSPLVKTAIHGGDPNWGRIAQAIGQSGARFDPDAVSIKINGTLVLKGGLPCKFDREALRQKIRGSEVLIEISVGSGKGNSQVWTCDFSEEYIRINAEYN